MNALLPETHVQARGLTWEVVDSAPAGKQQRFRLRCLQGDLRGTEMDLLHPFEAIEPVTSELDPEKAGRLRQWLLYHEAFLLEQALGPSALPIPGTVKTTSNKMGPMFYETETE